MCSRCVGEHDQRYAIFASFWPLVVASPRSESEWYIWKGRRNNPSLVHVVNVFRVVLSDNNR